MKQRAVIVAPGRGTYNKSELGTLKRLHPEKSQLLAEFDAYRTQQDQDSLSALDDAGRFSGARHTRGDNASPLIYACAYFDFLSIDRDRFDIVGITGNSMGWYTALACAGALNEMGGLTVVNTMGTLMQTHLIGGQIVYPFVDSDWVPIPGAHTRIMESVAHIDARAGHDLSLSIDLGGMLLLAGNKAGLDAFEIEMPQMQDRFPMRLQNHAAFHTALQTPVAAEGRSRLPETFFWQPELALIDGRGALWYPKACHLPDLWRYTLDHQVVAPYDFTAAIRIAARELMPDVFIILGPGTTLGGAVAQSLIRCGWRGWKSKSDFVSAQAETPRLISMGMPSQRDLVL